MFEGIVAGVVAGVILAVVLVSIRWSRGTPPESSDPEAYTTTASGARVLSKDLEALFVRVGQGLVRHEYQVFPFRARPEEVPLFVELKRRDLITYRDAAGFLSTADVLFNATDLTQKGKQSYEALMAKK